MRPEQSKIESRKVCLVQVYSRIL
eukprot:SAG31_NODE_26215_length_446_cov_0.829971_1_plen_23_part_01